MADNVTVDLVFEGGATQQIETSKANGDRLAGGLIAVLAGKDAGQLKFNLGETDDQDYAVINVAKLVSVRVKASTQSARGKGPR